MILFTDIMVSTEIGSIRVLEIFGKCHVVVTIGF